MQMSRKTEEKEAEGGMDTLGVEDGVCTEAESKDNLPVMSGMVENKNVEVLRDSGCNGIIVERESVDEADFIG